MSPASLKTVTPATYQDALDAPSGMVAEIIGGRLHLNPRPAMRPAFAGSSLVHDLGGPFQFGRRGPGGWWITYKPELHIGEEIAAPDLAGWRKEMMPEYPDDAYCTVAPDWVCEIHSARTRRVDLSEKRPLYARENVRHLWIVEPIERELEAFELRDGQWLLIAALKDNDQVRMRPFDAVERRIRCNAAASNENGTCIQPGGSVAGHTRLKQTERTRALADGPSQ